VACKGCRPRCNYVDAGGKFADRGLDDHTVRPHPNQDTVLIDESPLPGPLFEGNRKSRLLLLSSHKDWVTTGVENAHSNDRKRSAQARTWLLAHKFQGKGASLLKDERTDCSSDRFS
jgi:hypothetical protein